MANRSYTARQDFKDGWNILANRYARPGTVKEMVNAMLDPLAEGALRQAYGSARYGLTGTINQFTRAAASGRYKGICHLSRVKEADFGNADTLVAGMMETTGGTTTANFYSFAKPEDSTRKFNFPFGNTLSSDIEPGGFYGWMWHDWLSLMGQFYTDNVVTMTVVGPGTATSLLGGLGLQWEAPAGAGTSTFTVRFAHLDTGEVGTVTMVMNRVAGATPTIYQAFPYNTGKNLWTGSSLSYFALHPILTRFPTPATWSHTSVNTASAGKLGKFFVDSDVWGGAHDSPLMKGKITSTSTNNKIYQFLDTISTMTMDLMNGTVSVQQYFTQTWMPSLPYNNLGAGIQAPMRLVHSISNVVQSTLTPYGIWKQAGMNGFSYFYSGIDTPFRVREDDIFGDSTTYSKSVGMSRPDPTGVTVSNTTSVDGENNVEGVVRYFLAYLDDELDEGPLTPYFPNYTGGVYSSTVTEANRAQGWDAGTGSRVELSITATPATVSKVRIYRTMKDRGSPYLVTDVDYATPTITVIDTVSDLDLGDLPWTHGDPPPTTFFSPVVYYDRVWGLGTRQGVADSKRTYLFWTDVNAPESFFWDGNYAAVYAEDGDEATALVRDRSGLIIFKNNHTYRMVGRSPEDITFVEVTVEDSDTGVGCPHPNAAVATDKGTFFYWKGAVYLYTDGGAIDISRSIAPLFKGESRGIGPKAATNWEMNRGLDAESVQLSYDPKFDRLFVSGNLISSAFGEGPSVTYIFDAKNGIWAGQMDTGYGFVRRYNIPIFGWWQVSTAGYLDYAGWADTLIAAPLNSNEREGLNVTDVVVLSDNLLGDGAVPRTTDRSFVEFHPIIGNLGPFASKRFLWVDYLLDGQVPFTGVSSGTGEVESELLLDGATTGDTDVLPLESGAIYADRIRHVAGDVGAELAPRVAFRPTEEGTIIRLFEYSVTWQNLGRHGTKGVSQAPLTSFQF